MIYVTADTHFSHDKVIRYESRPFQSIEHMNNAMVENWNKEVSALDTVYHLGDFGWGGKDVLEPILKSLNGYKILIMGNHDRRKSKRWWHGAGFDDVIQGFLVLDGFYALSHEPVPLKEESNLLNIHGHMHLKKLESRLHVNACVEHRAYKPVLLDRLKEEFDEDIRAQITESRAGITLK